ncbi:MFS general substrate transporter, partial [Periconia macrospinosa]
WRFYVVTICLLLVNIVLAWDVVVITIALPAISFALHGSAIQTYWVGLTFLVAATAFLPLFSAFSDIFGRKPILLSSLLLFSAGSLVAGVSGTMDILLFGRLIQGIGAGGIYSLSDLIACDLVSPLDKRRLNTALGAVWALGAVTGPAIGEALAKDDHWRWIFWVNLPFCVTASVVLFACANLRGPTSGSIGPKLRKFDWFGFILLAASMTALFLGISWAGSLYSWSHTSTLLPLQFGIVGLAVYGIWVWFSPFTPVISMDGFMDRTIIGAFAGTMLQGIVLGGLLYFMPFFFTVAKLELGSLPVGVRWLPWTLPFVLCVVATFIVVSKWNIWLPAIWAGWALTTLGVSLTILFTRTVANAGWVCIAMITGAGLGILYPSLHTAAELIAAQDESKTRRAITNFSFFHFLGKSFGVAMGLCIFENELLRKLKANSTFTDFAERYTNDAVATVAKIQISQGGEGSPKQQAMDIYVGSLKTLWMVLAGISALALILSFCMKPKGSNKPTAYTEVEMDRTYIV